jgi:hypothetical protein
MADNPTDSHYEELDRLAARSLAARENSAQADARSDSGRAIWPWAVAGLLFAFLLGLIGSPLFEREARGHLPAALQTEQLVPADPRVDGLAERVARLEAERGGPQAAAAVPQDVAGIGVRLQAVESRAIAAETNDANLLAMLDALAAELSRTRNAVAQTDSRTRDLFLLSVARRMVEVGRPLTPIEDVIDARFRADDGAAVEALSAWSAAPQTRETLQSRLETLAQTPATDEAASWWDRLKRRLSGLVTVRGEAPEGPDSEALMAQARDAMAAGDLGLAISALGDGDWPPAVAQWVQDARTLQAAEHALDRLETSALESGVAALQAPEAAAAG